MRGDKGFNIHAVFRSISRKLQADFEASAQILHSGGKGSSREGTFRTFLTTYLPTRYAIGQGEVLHWSNQRSRQCDVVIFDHARCPRLLADDEHSVFPLESVYGTIEVKSVLTHGELEDAFQKIVSVKQLVPKGGFTMASGGLAQGLARPYPFGGIFAYSADRSLEAIHEQLLALEASHGDLHHVPDTVVILGAGMVGRRAGARVDSNVVDSKWLSAKPMVRFTKQHTLLRFYLEMIRELNAISLESVDLGRYLGMPELVDGHRVSGHGRLVKSTPGKVPGDPMRKIGPSGIRKILEYCKSRGQVTMADYAREVTNPNVNMDAVPQELLATKVYVFNPHGRKALGVDKTPMERIAPVDLTIDGDTYMVDLAALDASDFLDDEDAVFEDLFNA